MKIKICSGILMFVSTFCFGQVVVKDQDISLQNARILPAPTWIGGVVEGYFTMTAIEGVNYKPGESPIEISVCFNRIAEESIAATTPVVEYDIVGDVNFLNWKYAGESCWKGYISKDISPMSAAGVNFPGLIAAKSATVADANARAGVGLYIKLTRQHSREPNDDLNDFTNNYTFTIDPLSKNSSIPESVLYPNTNDGKFTVDVTLSSDSDFKVALFNSLGAMLKEVNHQGKAGLNSIQFNAEGIKNGLYLVKIITKDREDTKSIVIEK